MEYQMGVREANTLKGVRAIEVRAVLHLKGCKTALNDYEHGVLDTLNARARCGVLYDTAIN